MSPFRKKKNLSVLLPKQVNNCFPKGKKIQLEILQNCQLSLVNVYLSTDGSLSDHGLDNVIY